MCVIARVFVLSAGILQVVLAWGRMEVMACINVFAFSHHTGFANVGITFALLALAFSLPFAFLVSFAF